MPKGSGRSERLEARACCCARWTVLAHAIERQRYYLPQDLLAVKAEISVACLYMCSSYDHLFNLLIWCGCFWTALQQSFPQMSRQLLCLSDYLDRTGTRPKLTDSAQQ